MDRIGVGYVARAHGVRGELRVQTHDPMSTTLLDVKHIFIGGREVTVESIRETQGAYLMMIKGVSDRDAAEALRGQPVEVLRAEVPLADGEYLLADLPGCAVVDLQGAPLGHILELVYGPQVLLVIDSDDGERMLPLVPQLVPEVDIGARRVVVDLPEGLPVEPKRNRS